jgi:ATP-dependent RNA helicase DHX29
VVTCDSDIEPDELAPQYLAAKTKLLELERGSSGPGTPNVDDELAVAKLEAKIRKIESDVLFDKFEADQKWRAEKIVLEKQFAASKKEAKSKVEDSPPPEEPSPDKTVGDGISGEAERIAAEILSQSNEDDDDIGGLFASLPQNEVDAETGETRTVINSADGAKIVIRDFGKWTGFSPRRALEEACRSR